MMKYILSILLVMLLVMLPVPSSAQTLYQCAGPVTQLSVSPGGGGGSVVVSGMGGIVAGYLCSFTMTVEGLTPDACKAIYARLLLAELTGQVLWISFRDNLTCTTHPAYAWLDGYAFGPGTVR